MSQAPPSTHPLGLGPHSEIQQAPENTKTRNQYGKGKGMQNDVTTHHTRAKHSKKAAHCPRTHKVLSEVLPENKTATASQPRQSLRMRRQSHGVRSSYWSRSERFIGDEGQDLELIRPFCKAAEGGCGTDPQASDARSELMDVNLLWRWQKPSDQR